MNKETARARHARGQYRAALREGNTRAMIQAQKDHMAAMAQIRKARGY